MDFRAAALLVQHGLSPQDFEQLAEEYDLLQVKTGLLHDPESCGERVEHLEDVLSGPLVWLPGFVPYGDLWHAVKAGAVAQPITLCPSCFPSNS